jgi:hypothetical protein
MVLIKTAVLLFLPTEAVLAPFEGFVDRLYYLVALINLAIGLYLTTLDSAGEVTQVTEVWLISWTVLKVLNEKNPKVRSPRSPRRASPARSLTPSGSPA